MPIDPAQHHRDALADLARRHVAGEIDQPTLVAESTPHAAVVAALAHEAVRDGALALVRLALANPRVVEALAVGVAHYLTAPTPEQEG